jgi:ABC-type nitrate/sulfonate/bicarbonate transport system substrate-binding protein
MKMAITRHVVALGAAVAISLSLAACGSSGSGGSGGGASANPELTVMIGSPSINYAQFWIAEGEGLFKKHGVDVHVETYAGGTTMLAALAAGQVDLIASGIGLTMPGIDRGADLKLVFGTSNLNYKVLSVIGGKGIHSFADIAAKGTDCTVVDFPQGSVNHGLTKRVIDANDIRCRVVTEQAPDAGVKLVASGQADLSVALPAQADVVVHQGQATMLYDAQTATAAEGAKVFPYEILFGGIWTSGQVLDSKAEAVKRFVAAMDEATGIIKSQTPEELAAITAKVKQAWGTTPVETIANQWRSLDLVPGTVTAAMWDSSLKDYAEVLDAPSVKPGDEAQSYKNVVNMGPLESSRG